MVSEALKPYGKRDLNAVAQFRMLSPTNRTVISKMFKDARTLRVTIRPETAVFRESVSPEFTGVDAMPHSASVRATIRYDIQSIDGEGSTLVRNVIYTLERSGQTWKIASESILPSPGTAADRR